MLKDEDFLQTIKFFVATAIGPNINSVFVPINPNEWRV